MHSSRMHTVRCSGHLSCHACHPPPPPCMAPLPHMPPSPHMPPLCHTHTLSPCMPPFVTHAHFTKHPPPSTMHALLCHTFPLHHTIPLCHECLPFATHAPFTMHGPFAMHKPPFHHTCPPFAMHAPSTHMPHMDRMTDACENITFLQLLLWMEIKVAVHTSDVL